MISSEERRAPASVSFWRRCGRRRWRMRWGRRRRRWRWWRSCWLKRDPL